MPTPLVQARRPRALLIVALAALAVVLPAAARPARAQTTRTVTVSVSGQGTVTSTPAGIVCSAGGGSCSAPFPGTPVTLVVTPTDGWTFLGWSGGCTGVGVCTLPASTIAQAVSATFGPVLTVVPSGTGSGTVTSIPAAIACVVTGGVAAGTCSAAFAPGTIVTLVQSAGVGSSPAGCTPTCGLALSAPTTITTSFSGFSTAGAGSVVLTGAGSGSGIVSSTPGGVACPIAAGVVGGVGCSATFPAGTVVTLTASPLAGSAFTGWSGACSNASPTCTVTVGSGGFVSATANFNAQPTGVQVITVAGRGTGSGTVTSTPTALVCNIVNGVAVTGGPITPGQPLGGCAAGFPVGAVVNLLAVAADDGSRFGGWSGACTGTSINCRFTVVEAGTVTATFTRAVTLTVAGSPGGGTGRVTSSPAGIDCTLTAGTPASSACSAEFAPGTVVTLSATPGGASTPGGPAVFTGWGGACSGTGTCQVTLTQSATVRAGFAGAPPVVVSGSGNGSGRVTSTPSGLNCAIEAGVAQTSATGSTCRATFAAGTSVTIVATPAVGQAFVGWSGVTCGSVPPGGSTGVATCTVTVRDSVGVGVGFVSLPTVADAITDLLTGAGLGPTDRGTLDQLGNRDGSYNLGDLLALLDRTGQRLGSDVLARLLALPPELARPISSHAAPRPAAAPRRP